jgi:hypothetical protein
VRFSWHTMQQQGNGEEALASTEASASQSLVIDDEEDSGIEQQECIRVHFARSEPSLTTHLTPVPLHFDPSRGKRGSFLPGHGPLASSSSSTDEMASLAKPLSWPDHSSLQHRQPGHIEGYECDSRSTTAHNAISWNIRSPQHVVSSPGKAPAAAMSR